MNEPQLHQHHDHPHTLTIYIDGRPFTTVDDDQEAAALLRLAGLDPASYDLGIIKHGKTERFPDVQLIKLHNGEEFVTIRQQAPVA
jgi:hypothetical protein